MHIYFDNPLKIFILHVYKMHKKEVLDMENLFSMEYIYLKMNVTL